jgi:probable F420-dependent oxidoreductase
MAVTTRPQFAFAIFPYDGLGSDELARVVQAGERAGFDIVHFPEHLLPPLSSHEALYNRTWWDLSVLCAFLAARTERIRFHLSVLVLPYHPPVQLAKALVTLDHVTNGRILVGVGAGWYEEEFEQLGIPFAERGAITDEYVEAMIELWTAEEPRFEGKYVSFENVSFYPKPVQKPHPPLIMGGTGARPFRRTAAHGAGWTPMTGTLEEAKGQIETVRALLREAGRDEPDFVFGRLMAMSPDTQGEKAAEHIRGHVAERAPTTPEERIEQVNAYVDAGVNLIQTHYSWKDPDDFIRQLEAVGRHVIARFR